MDAHRFDRLARALSRTGQRRGVLAFLAALPPLGGLAALLDDDDTTAKRRKRGRRAGHGRHASAEKKKKKKKKKKKTTLCLDGQTIQASKKKKKKLLKSGATPGACLSPPPPPPPPPSCTAESKAVTCSGNCGSVSNNCQQTVDCGSCTCDPPCAACFVCNETTLACEVDPDQQGDACGQAGQFCHADGACACDTTSCPDCATCQANGACTEPCGGVGCCDNGACLGGNTAEICGAGGETCAACSGSTPICVNGACTACSGANPCPGGRVCVGGFCELCDVCASGCDFTSVQAAITAAPAFALITICPGTYGKITVNKPHTLIGAGGGANAASNTILDAAGSGIVVTIDGNVTATLHSLRITGGDDATAGGVYNPSGDLTITRCTVIENETSASGGGIYNSGILTLLESTISGNTAGIVGGGLENNDGEAFVFSSSFSGNSAQGGGGLHNFSSGTILIDNTTVTGNTATSPANLGGGIQNDGGAVTLQNGSSVTANIPNDCVGAISGGACGA